MNGKKEKHCGTFDDGTILKEAIAVDIENAFITEQYNIKITGIITDGAPWLWAHPFPNSSCRVTLQMKPKKVIRSKHTRKNMRGIRCKARKTR